ncbi:hypothetical protein BPAE_0288g00080 [Botrytis paeoniae]|uniref:Uncharacterized protein n=1 Tax=Botrytis paeoniae TaxID=278948 RepID=A0A4Z1F8A0_9HELO|nr:hypothetical protein BPAE_0288g00080 [Botrytis paeoniae]
MTAWEMEDWMDEKLKKSGRGYYVPKGEIFCHALNQDGSLCKNTLEKIRDFDCLGSLRNNTCG